MSEALRKNTPKESPARDGVIAFPQQSIVNPYKNKENLGGAYDTRLYPAEEVVLPDNKQFKEGEDLGLPVVEAKRSPLRLVPKDQDDGYMGISTSDESMEAFHAARQDFEEIMAAGRQRKAIEQAELATRNAPRDETLNLTDDKGKQTFSAEEKISQTSLEIERLKMSLHEVVGSEARLAIYKEIKNFKEELKHQLKISIEADEYRLVFARKHLAEGTGTIAEVQRLELKIDKQNQTLAEVEDSLLSASQLETQNQQNHDTSLPIPITEIQDLEKDVERVDNEKIRLVSEEFEESSNVFKERFADARDKRSDQDKTFLEEFSQTHPDTSNYVPEPVPNIKEVVPPEKKTGLKSLAKKAWSTFKSWF